MDQRTRVSRGTTSIHRRFTPGGLRGMDLPSLCCNGQARHSLLSLQHGFSLLLRNVIRNRVTAGFHQPPAL